MVLPLLQEVEDLDVPPTTASLQLPASQTKVQTAAPVLALETIIDLIRASASEISGTEMDADAHFASHHFDSLSAVELANTIGKAVGLTLSSQHLFSMMDVPPQE